MMVKMERRMVRVVLVSVLSIIILLRILLRQATHPATPNNAYIDEKMSYLTKEENISFLTLSRHHCLSVSWRKKSCETIQ